MLNISIKFVFLNSSKEKFPTKNFSLPKKMFDYQYTMYTYTDILGNALLRIAMHTLKNCI